jgi:UDP-glucose:(heptosyl)LPS alpha-1,3-glucosyltransferase
MRLAFIIDKFFPYAGRQRDFRLFVDELKKRGHACRVYCLSWQGEPLVDVDLRRVPARALSKHRRDQRFLDWVRSDLARDPVDGVIGFDKMPGLDICYAADVCCLDQTLPEQGRFYRWSAGFRHRVEWERAVFAPDSATHILLTTASERDTYRQHHNTPAQRLHLLPPGVAPDRRAPQDAPRRRKAVRTSLGLEPQELALLFVGSEFASKGLDQAITALAHLREDQPSVKSRLLVVGQGKSRRYQRLARRLGVAEGVVFLGGRDDIGDLMLGADVLVHPAQREVAGIVLLEALAAGLPVVAADACGFAHHVKAARAGILLPSPFSQEQLDQAVMRCIDGIYRADRRESALLYARLTDLYSMHREGADLIEQLINQKREVVDGG